MGLDKFLAFVCSQQLHLTRLDHFKDPFEGRLPKKLEEAYDKAEKEVWDRDPDVVRVLSHEKYKDLKARFSRPENQRWFVNCWHESEVESAALWEQYANSGIAVESTIRRLRTSIRDPRPYYISRVQYIDFETYEPVTPLERNHPACLKRMSFQHELEVRVICSDDPTSPANDGLALSASFKKLVKSVWISPFSPKWLESHVKTFLKRFRIIDIPVEQSALYKIR